MKTQTLVAALFLSLSSPLFAFAFFPGSTLELKEDVTAVDIKDRWLASSLLKYAIMSEGKNLTKLPAITASTEFCLIEKDSEIQSLKGNYIYNGYAFTNYNSTRTRSLGISCFKAVFNNYNSQYIAKAANVEAGILSRALGGYADLQTKKAENIQIGNYTFSTGSKQGREVHGDGQCSVMTFKAEGKIKMLFSNPRGSCTMDVERWTMVSTVRRGYVFKVEGAGNFVGVQTRCSVEFDLENGQLNGRALQNIQHNNSGSYCQY